MSVLSDALPADINAMRNDVDSRPFASAILEHFTSGTAPPWFTTMPFEVRSFFVLDIFPNEIRKQPMTSRVLGESALPGVTASGTLATATPSTDLTSNGPATTSNRATSSIANSAGDAHERLGVLLPAILVPLALMLLSLAILLCILGRRRRKLQRVRDSTSTHPIDPERVIQGWQESVAQDADSPHEIEGVPVVL